MMTPSRRLLTPLVLAGLCALPLGCGPATRADQVATLTGVAASGRGVYEANCSSCHGSSGRGTTTGVSLASARTKGATDFLGKVIEGVPGTAMSTFASLSDQQLADVYAYVTVTLVP